MSAPLTVKTSFAGLKVRLEPPSITPSPVWNKTFKAASVFVPATVGIVNVPPERTAPAENVAIPVNVETPVTLRALPIPTSLENVDIPASTFKPSHSI